MRWAVAVVLAGCFDPRPPDGAPCGPGRACPTGQSCSTLDDRCYYDPPGGAPDTATPPETPPMTTCTPRRLLTGGLDLASQGWTIERSQTGSFSINYAAGATTLTTVNGRQLIVLRNAFPPDRWMLQIVAEVVASGGHTPMNGAAVIMASFHDPAGDDNDRKRMLVLDEDKIAWGEGGTSVGHDTRAQVVYRLQRSSSGAIQASASSAGGSASIAGGSFTSNGSIAIGDQSTEPGLDSTLRLITVDLTCP